MKALKLRDLFGPNDKEKKNEAGHHKGKYKLKGRPWGSQVTILPFLENTLSGPVCSLDARGR